MADYYARARGSALESRGHLAKAAGEEFISAEELTEYDGKFIEIGKMLTPCINYLQRSDWKTRGQPPEPKTGDSRPRLATVDLRLSTTGSNLIT